MSCFTHERVYMLSHSLTDILAAELQRGRKEAPSQGYVTRLPSFWMQSPILHLLCVHRIAVMRQWTLWHTQAIYVPNKTVGLCAQERSLLRNLLRTGRQQVICQKEIPVY